MDDTSSVAKAAYECAAFKHDSGFKEGREVFVGNLKATFGSVSDAFIELINQNRDLQKRLAALEKQQPETVNPGKGPH